MMVDRKRSEPVYSKPVYTEHCHILGLYYCKVYTHTCTLLKNISLFVHVLETVRSQGFLIDSDFLTTKRSIEIE